MTATDGYASGLDAVLVAKLAHTLRALFPHDRLGDGPYKRAAETIVGNVAHSARQTGAVIEGIRDLEGLVGGRLATVDVDELGAILRHITQTEFFQIMLTSTIVSLYSDPETWTFLGYEGFSSDQGGYLHRGFGDIDWLPAPRIIEYEGEDRLTEYVPAIPGQQVSFSTTKKVPTI